MRDFERPVMVARYGLMGAVVLFVLWVGYGASANKRYETANGIPGELLAGESAGQSFVARYDGLAGVEVHFATLGLMTDTNRSALVMRLREPASGEVLATGVIEPGQVLEADQWYLFKFAPLAESKGKKYLLEVEAPEGAPGRSMSLFWFQPGGRGDPYEEGQAYRNSEATRGDLAFGLKYEASPLQVWGGMIGEAGENTSELVLWLLLIVGGVGAVFLVGPGWRWLDGRGRRWGLGVALGVGLVHGLLYMLILPPWQGPDEYAHYAYVALMDRHDLDHGAVDALDLNGKDKDVALVEAINASATRNDFTRTLRGNGAPGAPTRTDAFVFQQVRQPPAFYWLSAVVLRAARLVGISADPVANPDAALYVMRSVSVMLSLLVIWIAWLAFGTRVAVAVALFPMHAFVGSMINNDILAEVAVSALVLGIVGLLKTAFGEKGAEWPSRRGLVLAGICTVVAVAGVVTKATAPAAAIPLLAGGLAVWVGLGVWRRSGTVRKLNAWVGWGIAAVIVAVGFFVLFEQREEASAGWFRSYTPLVSAQRVGTDPAHDGDHAIALEAVAGTTAVQRVVPPLLYHPALRVTLAGWVRLEAAPGEIVTGPVVGQLAVMDGAREAGVAFVELDPAGKGDWTRLEVTGEVQANAEQIELLLGVREGNAPGAQVLFDDMSIKVDGGGVAWSDPTFKAAIVDASGEQARWTLRPLFEQVLPDEASSMTSAVFNPQPFSKVELWREYARLQWVSFWGSFGWLSIDLPGVAYPAIGALVLLAGVGLVLEVMRRRKGGWGWRSWMGVVAGISLVAATGVGFAKQTALTAYGGLPAPPQGRYLFVLIIPIVWMVGEGLRAVFERFPGREARVARVAKLILMDVLVLGAVYCLLALIVPYYYG